MSFDVSRVNFQATTLSTLKKTDTDKNNVISAEELAKLDMDGDKKLSDQELSGVAEPDREHIVKAFNTVRSDATFDPKAGVISFNARGEADIIQKQGDDYKPVGETSLLPKPTDVLKDSRLTFRVGVLKKNADELNQKLQSQISGAEGRLGEIKGKRAEITKLLDPQRKPALSEAAQTRLKTLDQQLATSETQASDVLKAAQEKQSHLNALKPMLEKAPPDTAALQKFLKENPPVGEGQAWDLGQTGSERDGLDNKYGQKTDAALRTFIAAQNSSAQVPAKLEADCKPIDDANSEIAATQKAETEKAAREQAKAETRETRQHLGDIHKNISDWDSDNRLRDLLKNQPQAIKAALAVEPELAPKMAAVLYDGVFSDDDKTAMKTLFDCANPQGRQAMIDFAVQNKSEKILNSFTPSSLREAIKPEQVKGVLDLLGKIGKSDSSEAKTIRALAASDKPPADGVTAEMAAYFAEKGDRAGLQNMGTQSLSHVLNQTPQLTTGLLRTLGDHIKPEDRSFVNNLAQKLKPDAQLKMLEHFNRKQDKLALQTIAQGLTPDTAKALYQTGGQNPSKGALALQQMADLLEPGELKAKIELLLKQMMAEQATKASATPS